MYKKKKEERERETTTATTENNVTLNSQQERKEEKKRELWFVSTLTNIKLFISADMFFFYYTYVSISSCKHVLFLKYHIEIIIIKALF